MRRRIDQASRQDRERTCLRAGLAKSTDCLLLLLCLAAIGVGGSDERLVNGFRLIAALIQRHARLQAAGNAGSASPASCEARPHGTLMQIK